MTLDTNNSNSIFADDFPLESILESAPVGILIFDEDGIVQKVTSNFFVFGVLSANHENQIAGSTIFKKGFFTDCDISDELNELENGNAFEKVIQSKKMLSGGIVNIILKGAPLFVRDEYRGGLLIIEDAKSIGSGSKDELIHSEDYHSFLLSISDYFLITDPKGDILFYPTENISGDIEFLKNIFNNSKSILLALGNTQKLNHLMNFVKDKNETIYDDISISTKESDFIFRIELVPIVSDQNKLQSIIVLLKDISDEANREKIIESEIHELQKYQSIVANVAEALITTDISGKITYWNDYAAEFFGYTRSEIFGKSIEKVIPSIDKNFLNNIKNELEINKVWEGSFNVSNNPDSNVLILRIGIIGEDESRSFVFLCRDITERVRSEKALRLSEEKFRNIVTNTHEYICTLDLQGNITYVNPYFKEIFGLTEDEFLSLNFKELISETYLKSNNFKIDVKSFEKFDSIELPLITKDDKEIYVLASFTAVLDLNGNVKYFNVVLTDISLKKDAQKDLLLIRSVFDASQEGIIVSCNRKLILANDRFLDMFGYAEMKEVVGKDPLDFIDDADIPRVAENFQAREENGETADRYEFIGKRKDETTFYVENSVSAYKMDEQLYIVSVLRDVTESRKAAQLLFESEMRLRNISENIDECMWTAERVDGKLMVVFYTAAIEKITGYSNKAFIQNSKLWIEITHPDEGEQLVKKLKRLYRDSSRNFEELEYRIINKLGNTIWIRNKITILRDDKGEVNKIFGLVSDISLHKKAKEDMNNFNQNLQQLNEAKDRFLSIISHDLRTPFSSIMGYTDLLLADSDFTDDKLRQYVTYIRESSTNMLNLVNSLLDWTRLQTGRVNFEPERINSKDITLKSIQMLAGSAIQKNIKLVSRIETDLFVHADAVLLLQVFNNLISNAIKFTKSGGSIWVNAEPVFEKKHVEFSVKDDGVGIKKGDLEKLFRVDSKFTSKGTDGEKGSGLGLSLVKDIVNKHGGDIWVESKKGDGSTFFFSIPISSTKILLVDDMNTDRLLYSKLLRSFLPDYTIEEAANGKEAFDIIEKSVPALVISDHNMPLMSGYDLVKQIINSDMKFKPPVIILSGDIIESIEEEYRELGVEFIFRKPVNLAKFKSALDKSLKKAIVSSYS